MSQSDCSPLFQLVYTSLAGRKINDAAVAKIAEVSLLNNMKAMVTGLLLFDGDRFIQALEGSSYDVLQTMRRIELDNRHSSVSYLKKGYVASREFGTWSMNYKRVSEQGDPSLFLGEVKALVGHVASPDLKAAFIGFAVLGNKAGRR